METSIILVAGATGHLGGLIAGELMNRKARVRAIVRRGSQPDKIAKLRAAGIEIFETDLESVSEAAKACEGVSCVVSALSGLRDVIVDRQTVLLKGAVGAKVPRFIPSDYSLDFTKQPQGMNRNLDWRREFHDVIQKYPIQVTSIMNGGFTYLLKGQAPFILFKKKRVLYWKDPDQKLDFTSIENVAAYTAAAAMDGTTPRILGIAGDRLSAREMAQIASDVTGQKFKVFGGPLWLLEMMIKTLKLLMPAKNDIYPPWQGMQYMHNMFRGLGKLDPIDNSRYPGIRWTTVRDTISEVVSIQS